MRLVLRRRRQAIGRARRNHCERRAAAHLLRWRHVRRARRVAVYLSVHSELATPVLIRSLQRRGCEVWVPRTRGPREMGFACLRPGARLRRDALGLPRPARDGALRRARAFDLIVLPLLGFDGDGHRLGNGAGYYDRALACRRKVRRPLLVGYAYAVQEAAEIPRDPWDVRLDAVVTEHGLRRFR
ncbi:MAG: 5-formyltetrahydrofolate cyclo-ligase [Nevskia sp.]|nr:5-formyltetrahydrofolate cyclo-ligase [Nevskia sp.]